MASISTPISSTSLLCNSYLNRRNIVGCSKRSYTPRAELKDATTTKNTIRRTAKYPPSIWCYDFIQSLSSVYTEEKYLVITQTLKEKVRSMINYKESGLMVENLSSILSMVDDLQRLGISYHFDKEIRNALEKVYNSYYKSHELMDLNLKSLGFRILRQNGYHIPQDMNESTLTFQHKLLSKKLSAHR